MGKMIFYYSLSAIAETSESLAQALKCKWDDISTDCGWSVLGRKYNIFPIA